MSDDFTPLDNLLEGLLEGIASGGRRKLSSAIATDLRSANARRIKANVTPDGAAMAPRKGEPRKTGKGPSLYRGSAKTRTRSASKARMARMFQRASAPSILRREADENEARVGYPGAAARIMAVHHYGLRDTVSREPGAPEVTYAARPLIGLSAEDRARTLDKVIAHIGE